MLRPIFSSCRSHAAAVVLVALFVPLCLQAKTEIDTARVHEIAAMLPKYAVGLGEPASHREPWIKLAKTPIFEHWLKGAHAQLAAQPTKATDDLYLEYSRNGNRSHWQDVEFAVRGRLSTFALAECLEDRGEFLKPLEQLIIEICAEKTWVYPAHDRSLGNFNGTQIDIDLGSSRVAWELATIQHLLGDKFSPTTRKLIHDNLQRRIFQPYRDMAEGRRNENAWLRIKNNWNAVCHGGVVGAALAEIDSAEERAWFIVAAESNLTHFLNGFGTDGYCSEGMGYWDYGFGHFLMLSETIRQATGGKIDWMAKPEAYLPALYGQRAEILNGIYPSIADCHPGSRPDPQLEAYICRRFGLTPCDTAPEVFARPANPSFVAALFCFLPEKLPTIVPPATQSESPLRTWFSDGGVLICRQPESAKVPFAVSLKGGHNAENHNHNDVGSFIVVADRSMVIVDPGSEVYTARTFGSKRYESDLLNSFGHDVPVIAGQLQSPGAEHRAKVLETNFSEKSDRLSLDITAAYSVPTLTSLKRTFVFERGDNPSLTVSDDVELTKADTFETALLTWAKWEKVSANEFVFSEDHGAVRVKVDTGGVPFEIKSKQLEADASTPQKATRIGFLLKKPVPKAHVVFTITPEAASVAKTKTASR